MIKTDRQIEIERESLIGRVERQRHINRDFDEVHREPGVIETRHIPEQQKDQHLHLQTKPRLLNLLYVENRWLSCLFLKASLV